MLRQLFIVFTLSLNVFCELINKHEGSICTWQNATGKCVNIHKCESSQMFLKTKDYPPICTFEGTVPVICCTDCNTVQDARNIIFNPYTGPLFLTGRKVHDTCVNHVDKLDYICKLNARVNYTRILDPVFNCFNTRTVLDFVPGVLPPYRETHLALLGYGNDIKIAQWLCFGTIISERFILTAAHCLTNEKLGPVKFVALGIHKGPNTPEIWEKYKVFRTIPHPEYQPPSKYHDIALIEVEKKITFSSEVLPACLYNPELPTSELQMDTNALLAASVFLWDPDGLHQDVKDSIYYLFQFDEIQCSIYYPPQDSLVFGYNDTLQYCYGDTIKPWDSCKSINGGPLVATMRTFGCAPSIIGVTSFDRTCGTAGSSALFTKVLPYIPWIESVAWP